ncbi:MAG: Rad52/Rad22 family DNA repair protein [Candidatus Aenigmatarchaeota archaeon]
MIKDLGQDEIYKRLSAPFSGEAIQKTLKEDTKKGYDTTGIGYQFCVNRFNEVLGLDGWGYDYKIVKEMQGQFKQSGNPYFDITVEVSIWVGSRENVRKCVGGHIASAYSDALKGAITNAFKKTAAFWGVGKQAYEGTLDIDTKLEEEPNYGKVQPVIPEDVEPATDQQRKKLFTIVKEVWGDYNKYKDDILRTISEIAGREIRSSKELTKSEINKIITSLEEGLF